MGVQKYEGGCHCGAVRYEVSCDVSQGASKCNCSICTKVAQISIIVKPEAFKQTKGEKDTGAYAFAGKTATRYFCKHCGIHCFAHGFLEQVGGDYTSINLNTVDGLDPAKLKFVYWDGRHDNWQSGPRGQAWPINA